MNQNSSSNTPTSVRSDVPAADNEKICVELQNIIDRVQEITNDRVLRIQRVCDVFGIKKASVYRFTSLGLLPPNISIGSRAVGWLASEIFAVLEARKFASRAKQTVDMKAFVQLLIRSRTAE